MNIAKRNISQLSKESVEYIANVIPPVVSHISPDTPLGIAEIFATALKLTCFKIIDKASDILNGEADICDIDEDWRANYFDKCRIVHDDDMQTLWAKILAGEANKPGTYSKRTVNFVANMDKREAELFTNLCQYVCEIKNGKDTEFVPLLPHRDDFPYPMLDEDLNHLDSIGLIRLEDFPDEIVLHEPIEVSYYGKSFHLDPYLESDKEIPDDLKSVYTSRIKLTQIGKELYPIAGSTAIDGLLDYVCRDEWLEHIRTKSEDL